MTFSSYNISAEAAGTARVVIFGQGLAIHDVGKAASRPGPDEEARQEAKGLARVAP